MTYNANISVPSQKSRTFMVMRPKRRVTDFANVDTNIWAASFDYGDISKVIINNVVFTENENEVVGVGEWYYDTPTQTLYVYSTTDPDLDWVIAYYELRVSTESGYWYRDPMDASSPEVYWEGLLGSSPTWRQEVSDLLFGFFPVESSGFSMSNGVHFFDRHAYDSSWYLGEALVYHMLGTPAVANVKEIFRGYMRNIRWTSSAFEVEMESIFKVLDSSYLNRVYVDRTTFSQLDPEAARSSAEAWPIRKVYGRVEGFVPINNHYDPFNPVDTDVNRIWLVSQGQTNLATLVKNVNPFGTFDATHTALTSVTGLVVDDSIYLSDVNKGATIVSIDTGTNTVTHSSVGSRGSSTGATATRSWLGYVKIRARTGIIYTIQPEYWATNNYSLGSKGFHLADNFEGSMSIPDVFDPSQDQIYCCVYGETLIPSYSVAGTPVTTVADHGGNLNNIAAIIYALLREIVPFDPTAIDETSFQAAVAGREDLVGFTIPRERETHDYPTYRDIIIDLLRTGLMRMQINDFNSRAGMGLSLIGPLESVAEKEVDPTQFADFAQELSYEDVYSQVALRYQFKDVSTSPFANRSEFAEVESLVQDVAVYLHQIDRLFQIDSLHIDITEAAAYANRVAYILSERKSTTRLLGRNDFILAELGQTYQVEREALPGYDFERGTNRTRKYVVAESVKTTRDIAVRLEDQKGIEDNSGSW